MKIFVQRDFENQLNYFYLKLYNLKSFKNFIEKYQFLLNNYMPFI